MSKWQGAIIKEQGVTFAVMVVKPHILNSSEREQTVSSLEVGMRMPVVLAAENSRGGLNYWGRRDLVDFLKNVPPHAIPWQEITFS